MKRGPRRTPTSILKGRGSWLARTRAGEPEPEIGKLPPAPKWLLPEARAEWKRLAAELHACGLLTSIDHGAFAACCQAFAHWKAAEEWMLEHGSTYTVRDDKGTIKLIAKVPQFDIAQKALVVMRQFGSEFGLTPASRAGLNVKPPQAPSAKSKYFGHLGPVIGKIG